MAPHILPDIAHLRAFRRTFLRLIRARRPGSSSNKPWLSDDVLYQIFSYLGPADAARAGLVCTRWHRNSENASYREVVLHTSSPYSRLLAHTLLHHPHLRRHVRHLTVMHFTPYPEEHLYEWIPLLTSNALKTCRVFAVPGVIEKGPIPTFMDPAGRLEVVHFGHTYPEATLRAHIAQATDPARRQLLQYVLDHQGWQIDSLVPYQRDIEALAYPTPLPLAIERFSQRVSLGTESSSMRLLNLLYLDREGLSRQYADALLHSLGIFMRASNIVLGTLVYDAAASDASPDAWTADPDALQDRMVHSEPERCACTSDSSLRGGAQFPPSAWWTGGIGHTSTSLRVAAAKPLLDRIWSDKMPDGRALQSLSVQLSYNEPLLDVPEPCAVCGLSGFCTFYLPGDVPSPSLAGGTTVNSG